VAAFSHEGPSLTTARPSGRQTLLPAAQEALHGGCRHAVSPLLLADGRVCSGRKRSSRHRRERCRPHACSRCVYAMRASNSTSCFVVLWLLASAGGALHRSRSHSLPQRRGAKLSASRRRGPSHAAWVLRSHHHAPSHLRDGSWLRSAHAFGIALLASSFLTRSYGSGFEIPKPVRGRFHARCFRSSAPALAEARPGKVVV
jgi:hypothetical protein